MEATERDRLLIETHTNVAEMKRQIDTVFRKLNGVDDRFRVIDERCGSRGEVIAGLKMRQCIIWFLVSAVILAVIAGIVKLFLA